MGISRSIRRARAPDKNYSNRSIHHDGDTRPALTHSHILSHILGHGARLWTPRLAWMGDWLALPMTTHHDDDVAPSGELIVLTGAPGAGKTRIVDPLLVLMPGSVVIDIDEILDDSGHLLGVPIATPDGEPHWPAYGRLWEKVLQFSLRAGHRVVFCCPMLPEEFALPARWALLDCSDARRRRRLQARGWDESQIEDAITDAADARARFTTRFDSEAKVPPALAQEIAHWITCPPPK